MDKHDGTQPTATLAVDITGMHSHLFAHGAVTVTGGSMTYVGGTMDGTPITGPTTGSMMNAEAVVGGRIGVGRHVRLGAFVGIGRRTWDRDLKTVSAAEGYDEQYEYGYIPIGLQVEYAATSRLEVLADATVMKPQWYGTLHMSQLAGVDDTDITLVPDYGGRVRVAGAYAITRSLRAVGALGYENDHNISGPGTVATSNGAPLTDGMGNMLYLHEPYSTTSRYTINVGAAYAF
jgi:hypothetical protein